VGGAISISFFKMVCLMIIYQNFFENNFADFAGSIFTNHPAGLVAAKENVFCENSAYTQNHILLGSGAVFNMGGTMATFLTSIQNLYFMNVAEFKGKK